MPRFVVLRHECPPDYRDGPHWDLMIERAGSAEEHRLATWSLLDLPVAFGGDATEPVQATPLPDHRAAYLTYEGPLTGDRGAVRRVVAGEAEWLESVDTAERITVSIAEGSEPAVINMELRKNTAGVWLLTCDLNI